jgi:hypothetical protein
MGNESYFVEVFNRLEHFCPACNSKLKLRIHCHCQLLYISNIGVCSVKYKDAGMNVDEIKKYTIFINTPMQDASKLYVNRFTEIINKDAMIDWELQAVLKWQYAHLKCGAFR